MRLSRSISVLVVMTLAATFAVAQERGESARIERLMADTRGQAEIRVDEASGNARFVRFPARSMRSPMITNTAARTDVRAQEFFRRYGTAFGVEKPDTELEFVAARRDATGIEHAIFKQIHGDIPVFGGELRAHFGPGGDLFAANGTFVSGIKLDMTPRLAPADAERVAIATVADGSAAATRQSGDRREREHLGQSAPTDLAAISTALMVYREGLVRGTPGRDHLVWEVEVRNESVSIREFVYVDAHSGRVVDRITGIHTALDREVSETALANVIWDESNGDPTPLPAGWAGGTAQQLTDWQNEIDGAGETYNLFASMTAGAYDSYDNAGATMRTVNNDPNIFCPNANWNGVSTNYCSDVTADDTVAHEWGHAYTEYTNGLIYAWQSGALNESYSDIWGEVVDFLNGRGSDAPGGPRTAGSCSTLGAGAPSVDNSYRWLAGEDDPAFGGAIRDLWNPNCYGDPGKVTDTSLYVCSAFDNGGVHINSGIPNHAFALMVDGGTYNGVTVGAIGLTKASHIHWGAQNLLTPASNFIDHADALEASCAALTGTNLPALSTSVASAGSSGEIITAADCAAVSDAIAAVELRTPPTFCNFQTLLDPDAPALCEAQGSVQSFFVEDFEAGSLPAGWTVSSHDVANPATFDTPDWSVVGGLPMGASGAFAAFAPDLIIGDCAADDESGAIALDSPPIVLPAGEVPRVAFDHWVSTETGWDGGNVKVSVNGGPWTLVPGDAYSFNAYNDTLNPAPANTNPLESQDAFSGSDGGSVSGSWGQSQVNLYGLAFPGDTVQLRFDFGVDGCNGRVGWYVDRVEAYSCSDEPLPICGDGQLDLGEQCDDGNMADGDGCSAVCQVEDGFICDAPTPGSPGGNAVDDGSFEAGPFGGTWNEFSANFGTPICNVGVCGTGTGTGPSDGAFWTWFGGSFTAESGSVSQSVVIPTTATDLTFDLEQIVCDGADDFMELTIDGNQEFLTDGSSGLCGQLGYSPQTVDVSNYADGAAHTIEFRSETFSTNAGPTNFFVDRVVLSDNVPVPGSPSQCYPKVDDLACNAGIVAYDDGIPGSWTVIDNAGPGLVWSNIAGAGEFGNYTGGDGDAATVSSDRFGPADFDTELVSNPFSLDNQQSANLGYLVNYQNFAAFDFLDVDISTDGGSTWNNLLSWNEDHGGFRGTPGEMVSLDLAAYLGATDARLRWRYYDPTTFDWDWYAQVDNLALDCVLSAPRTLKEEARDLLASVDDNDDDSDEISKAVKNIRKSLWEPRWLDDYHLVAKKGKYVFTFEREAVKGLMDLLDDDGDSDSDSGNADELSPDDIVVVNRVIEKLILADDQLAQIALDQAVSAVEACSSDAEDLWEDIAKAKDFLARAREHAAAGRFDRAIDFYRAAWKVADKAIRSAANCAP